jgi:two-component system nitrogen regulation response regulator NtrX
VAKQNTETFTLLVVDDEKRVRESVRLSLSGEPYEIAEAETTEEAHRYILANQPDIILLDVHFQPGKTSLPLLEKLKNGGNQIPIVMLSGAASTKEATDAIKLGAYDFLEKPVTSERLRVTLQNAIHASKLKAREIATRVDLNIRMDIIGESKGIRAVKELIGQFGRRDAKVLITGETGTGKELVAHGIWRNSPRCHRPFIVVNSAAIPDTLIESELFGHKKGAFTGATANQVGKIEMADGGTLFLDEIGELSPMAQSKLLRFLETGEIQVLGSNKIKHCDVRLIAATSRNLQNEIKAGRFREDLYFRLNVALIEIPSLRDRKEDVLPIFNHFMVSVCQRYGEAIRLIDDDAKSALLSYSWPGNVRELRNVAERAVLLSPKTITRQVIESIVGLSHADEPSSDLPQTIDAALSLKDYRRKVESAYIEHILKLADGSVTKASQVLGLDRSHLHQKIKDLGL